MKKIYSASITPFKETCKIDQKSLEKLLIFNLGKGVDGFFFFGSMGEWALFNDSMRYDLLETAVDTIGDKAEIIVGISSTGLNGIFENIEKFSRYKVDSYAVILPGGWAGPKDPVSYIHSIADKSDRPVYLYYIPSANDIYLSKDQFKEVFLHKNIKGIKNSSDSLRGRKELLLLKKSVQFSLFEGQEWVVDESLILGCDGALVGMGSLAGKLFKRIARAVDSNQYKEAGRLQEILINIFEGVYGKDLSTIWIGQKYALQILGIFSTYITLVPEEQKLENEEKERIDKCIKKYRDYLV